MSLVRCSALLGGSERAMPVRCRAPPPRFASGGLDPVRELTGEMPLVSPHDGTRESPWKLDTEPRPQTLALITKLMPDTTDD